MVVREAVEAKHVPLYQTYGYGITTWSPLCSGLLTGKYNNGMTPDGSRLSALKDTPVG